MTVAQSNIHELQNIHPRHHLQCHGSNASMKYLAILSVASTWWLRKGSFHTEHTCFWKAQIYASHASQEFNCKTVKNSVKLVHCLQCANIHNTLMSFQSSRQSKDKHIQARNELLNSTPRSHSWRLPACMVNNYCQCCDSASLALLPCATGSHPAYIN